jgi:drug/metabolite transporter (DMT)-like permease
MKVNTRILLMDGLLIFTFRDLVAFMIPAFIGVLIFIRRSKRNKVRVNCLFLWLVLITGSFVEICTTIYTTYSYRHNHLYNNDNYTTTFNYDLASIVFSAIVMLVSVVLFLQELRLKKNVH